MVLRWLTLGFEDAKSEIVEFGAGGAPGAGAHTRVNLTVPPRMDVIMMLWHPNLGSVPVGQRGKRDATSSEHPGRWQ